MPSAHDGEESGGAPSATSASASRSGGSGGGSADGRTKLQERLAHVRVSTEQLINSLEGEYKTLEEVAVATDKARASGLEDVATAKNHWDAEKKAMVDTFIFKSEKVTVDVGGCKVRVVLPRGYRTVAYIVPKAGI